MFVRIPNRYSDNFGIPKFRIPIGTSSRYTVCATEGANEKCVYILYIFTILYLMNTESCFYYVFTLICSSYVSECIPLNTPPSNGTYQCRDRSLTLYDLDLSHICQKHDKCILCAESFHMTPILPILRNDPSMCHFRVGTCLPS